MSTTYYRIFDECKRCGRSDIECIGTATSSRKFLFLTGGLGFWKDRLKTGRIINDNSGHEIPTEEFFEIVQEEQYKQTNHVGDIAYLVHMDPEGYEYR